MCVMIVGLMFLFNFAGFDLPSGGVIDALMIDDLSSSQSSKFYSDLISILKGVAVAGILIGTFTRTPPTNYLIAILVITLLGAFMVDIMRILELLTTNGGGTLFNMIGTTIGGIMAIAFLISIIEWWKG